MTLTVTQLITIIATASVCTFATRLVPFLVFGGKKEPPKILSYLGAALPVAIIGVLIVYSIGDVRSIGASTLLPRLIAVFATALIHLWKRNTLLSIATGTIGYMLLIHFVF